MATHGDSVDGTGGDCGNGVDDDWSSPLAFLAAAATTRMVDSKSKSNGDEVETCVKQTSLNLHPPSLPNNNNSNDEEEAKAAVFSPPAVNRRSLNESINNTMSGMGMPRDAEISSHETCVGAPSPLNLNDQTITDNYQQEGEETGLKLDIANGRNDNNTNGDGGVKSEEADVVASIQRNYFKEDTATVDDILTTKSSGDVDIAAADNEAKDPQVDTQKNNQHTPDNDPTLPDETQSSLTITNENGKNRKDIIGDIETADKGRSPPEQKHIVEYSDTEDKKRGGKPLCQAKSCQKFTQGRHGFCLSHYNRVSLKTTKKKRKGRQLSCSTPKKQMIDSQSDEDDEGMKISALQKSMSPKRRTPKRRSPSTRPVYKDESSNDDDDDDDDEEEVEFISSTRSKRTRSSTSPSSAKRTRRKATHSPQKSHLRRSTREFSPPVKTYPLISFTGDDEEEDEEEDESNIADQSSEEVEVEVESWECHKCNTSNPPERSRCKECLGWKGGHRSPTAKGSKERTGLPISKIDNDHELTYSNNGRVRRQRKKPDVFKPQDGPSKDCNGLDSSDDEEGPRKRQTPKKRKGKYAADESELTESPSSKRMAQKQSAARKHSKSDEELVGRCISKKFSGKPYNGTISKFLPKDRLWSIEYDDGDSEEMEWKELKRSMELYDKLHKKKGSAEHANGASSLKEEALSTAKQIVVKEDSKLNPIENGSHVVVEERQGGRRLKPGGVARVTKVYQSANGRVKYNVAYILGGEEKGVDERYVSLCSRSPPRSSAKKRNLTQHSKPGAANNKEIKTEEKGDSVCEDDDISFSELELLDTSSTPTVGSSAPRREMGVYAGEFSSMSERAMLNRTRYELLNGRDFWICAHCAIAIPSLTTPCGKCNRMITFVPLEVSEFEDFVRKQREKNRQEAEEKRFQWQQKINELKEDWSDEEEETQDEKSNRKPVTLDHYKQEGKHGGLFCKYMDCRAMAHSSNGEGLCRDHYKVVTDGVEPTSYPLVLPEDRGLVTDFVLTTLEQMIPCNYGLGERKTRESMLGFPGIQCKHCVGKTGRQGRFFASSEQAMYYTTFTKSIASHLLDCAYCPNEIKDKLELEEAMTKVRSKEKNTKGNQDQVEVEEAMKVKSKEKNIKGNQGRRTFFHRFWCRVQRIELDDADDAVLRKKKKKKLKDKKKQEKSLMKDGVDKTGINGKSEDGQLKKA